MPRPAPDARVPTVKEVGGSLRERLELRGVRKLLPRKLRVHATRPRRARARRAQGHRRRPRRCRSARACAHKARPRAQERQKHPRASARHLRARNRSGLVRENPVCRAEKPGRRRAGPNPDLQFLTVDELEAVIRAIPDEVVIREPAPTRRGRPGPAPPPSPDVLGPVLRMIIRTAAMTGLRQSELRGLRWRDIDWASQRIRVRNTFVRGEHSSDGKSDLSTRRSVPWQATSPASSTPGPDAPPTSATTISCSHIPRRARR